MLEFLWIILFEVKPINDFQWYYEHGISLSQGKGYTSDGVLTARWPIGYPGFLAMAFYMFGYSIFIVQIINILLYTCIILLTYYCSKILFYSENNSNFVNLPIITKLKLMAQLKEGMPAPPFEGTDQNSNSRNQSSFGADIRIVSIIKPII